MYNNFNLIELKPNQSQSYAYILPLPSKITRKQCFICFLIVKMVLIVNILRKSKMQIKSSANVFLDVIHLD